MQKDLKFPQIYKIILVSRKKTSLTETWLFSRKNFGCLVYNS